MRPIKLRRWLLRSVLVSTLVVSGTVFLLYFALRSPSFLAWLLPQLTPHLESRTALDVTVNRARIDLLSGFVFDDITMSWHDPDLGHARVELDRAELKYRLAGLWHRRVQVRQFELAGMTLVGEFDLREAPTSPPEQTTATPAPLDMTAVERLLTSPPLEVIIDHIRIADATIDIRYRSQDQWLHYRGHLESLSHGKWTDQGLQIKTSVTLAKPEQVTTDQSVNRSNATAALVLATAAKDTPWLRAEPTLDIDLAAALTREDEQWRLTLGPIRTSLMLRDIRLQAPRDATYTATLGELEWQTTIAAHGDDSAHGTGLATTLPLHFTAHSELALRRANGRVDFGHRAIAGEFDRFRTLFTLDGRTGEGNQGLAAGLSPKRMTSQCMLSLDRVQVADAVTPTALESQLAQMSIDLTVQGERLGAATWPAAVSGSVDFALSDWQFAGELAPQQRLHVNAGEHFRMEFTNQMLSLDQPIADLALAIDQQISVPVLTWHQPGQSLTGNGLDATFETTVQGEQPAANAMWPAIAWQAGFQGQAEALTYARYDTQAKTRTTVTVTPDLNVSTRGSLADWATPLTRVTASVDQALSLTPASLQVQNDAVEELFRFQRIAVTSNTQLKPATGVPSSLAPPPESTRQIRSSWQVQLSDSQLPMLAQPLSASLFLTADADLGLRSAHLAGQIDLDEMPLLALDLTTDNGPDQLRVRHTFNAQLPMVLSHYHAAAAKLNTLGDLRLAWQGQSIIEHGQDDIRAVHLADATHWPAQAQGQIHLTQPTAPTENPGLRLVEPLALRYKLQQNQRREYTGTLTARTTGLQYPPLRKPISLHWSLAAASDWPMTSLSANSQMALDDDELFDLALAASNQPQALTFALTSTVHFQPDWQQSLDALAAIAEYGRLDAALEIDGQLRHPLVSMTDWHDTTSLNDSRATIETKLRLRQSSPPADVMLRLPEPLELRHLLHWSSEQAQGQLALGLPEFSFPRTLHGRDVQATLGWSLEDGLQPHHGSLEFTVSGGELNLTGRGDNTTVLPLRGLLLPAALVIDTHWNADAVQLDRATLDLADQLLAVDVAGHAAVDGQQFQVAGQMALKPRTNLLAEPRLSGTGQMTWPWRVTLRDGRLGVDSTLTFTRFGLTTDAFALTDLNGNINLREELERVPGNRWRFVYRVNPDPFQRVDFERIQPYLDERITLSATAIKAADYTIGPLLANLSLEQNLLQLARLELDLFGGHLAAGLYLDLSPGDWRVGVLGRATQVDLRALLPADSALRTSQYAPVSARVAVDFDLSQRLLEGRVDITDIDRIQLLQLLDLLDPTHQDSQLSQLRAVLRVSHPQRVSLVMRHSLMDMSVQLAGLGSPIRLSGLPLSSLVQRFAGDYVRQLDRLPLTE